MEGWEEWEEWKDGNGERMKKIHRRGFRIWFKDHGETQQKGSLDLNPAVIDPVVG